MSTETTGKEPKPPTNQWDVALFLVQRFPIYALLLAFLAVGYFAFDLLLRQRDQARQELAAEVDAAERKVAEALSKADQRIAEAAQRERAAYEAEANAKSNALFSVQDTLLTSSERIQKLVTAQISSMEQLDELRLTTATELDKRIEELQTERETILAEVARLNSEKDLIGIDVSLQNLQRVIDEGSYDYLDEIKALEVSFSAGAPKALQRIEERRGDANSPAMKAAIDYALYRKTGETIYLDAIVTAIGAEGEALGRGFYRTMFGCCEEREIEYWSKFEPSINSLAIRPGVSDTFLLTLIDTFYDQLPLSGRTLLRDDQWSRPGLWQVTARLVTMIKNAAENDGYTRSLALGSLLRFDLSAAHSLGYFVQSTDQEE